MTPRESLDRAGYELALQRCMRRGHRKAAVRCILRMQARHFPLSAEQLHYLRSALSSLLPRELRRMQADIDAWAELAGLAGGEGSTRTQWRHQDPADAAYLGLSMAKDAATSV